MNRREIASKMQGTIRYLVYTKGYAAPVDLLLTLEWLKQQDYQAWRLGQVPYLERAVSGSIARLNYTIREFSKCARGLGMRPSTTAYMQWGKSSGRRLRFSRSGDPNIESAYATHWLVGGEPDGKTSCTAVAYTQCMASI